MATKRKIKTPGVYLDSNGTYYLKYKNRTYRGFGSVAEAEIYKATLKLQGDDVSYVKLKVIIESFLQHEKKRIDFEEISYGTHDKKDSALKIYVTPELGEFSINKLSPLILRKFRDDLGEKELSSVHKNYILRVFCQTLDFAREYHGLKEDLTIFIKPFPKTSAEKKKHKDRLSYIWTDKDFSRFIDRVDNDSLKLVFILMFKHGLRIGEVQALQWRCVDFKKQQILIDGSITRKTPKGVSYIRKATKTENSERTIYLGNTINIMKTIIKNNKKIYKFNYDWYVTGNSKPLTDREIDRSRERAIKDGGVPSATNHEFRHMFVTNAWSKGIAITAISKYIGHKNISVTLSTYSHLVQSDENNLNKYIDNSSQNLLKAKKVKEKPTVKRVI